MKTSDFNFELPAELIARYPLQHRSASRLLRLSASGDINHLIFSDFPTLLTKNDVLIFNDTRVIQARLIGRKKTGGKVEILIERILSDTVAYAHVKANKSLRLPCVISLQDQSEVLISEKHGDLFKLEFLGTLAIETLLTRIGEVPLPRYIQRKAESLDLDRYQTIYAAKSGAVAAPTAGLHFDENIFRDLDNIGIPYHFITLHVGAGTFKPVLVEEISVHHMHPEIYEVTQEVCDLVNWAKAAGGRVIAVGTTTVRALETATATDGQLYPKIGETNIFIYPGYRFKCVDALITNFHLPESTLLMLVCALGGYEQVMHAYQTAIRERYRFYSYGDAMFVDKKDLEGECEI